MITEDKIMEFITLATCGAIVVVEGFKSKLLVAVIGMILILI